MVPRHEELLHVAHIVDTARQLVRGPDVVDPDEECFTPGPSHRGDRSTIEKRTTDEDSTCGPTTKWADGKKGRSDTALSGIQMGLGKWLEARMQNKDLETCMRKRV